MKGEQLPAHGNIRKPEFDLALKAVLSVVEVDLKAKSATNVACRPILMNAQSEQQPALSKEAKKTIQEIAMATGLDVQKVTSMLLLYHTEGGNPTPSKGASRLAAWRAANREKDLTTRAAWREKNREKVRASQLAWRKANKKKQRASQMAWRAAEKEKALSDPACLAKKKEKLRAYNAAYKAANKDKVRAWNRAWRDANRNKMRVKRDVKRKTVSSQESKPS